MKTVLSKVKFDKYLTSLKRNGNIKFPNCVKGEIFLSNYSNLTTGILQRLNVQPEEVYITKNKERISLHTNGGRNFYFVGEWSYLADPSINDRKVCIYQKENNQIQTTPYHRLDFTQFNLQTMVLQGLMLCYGNFVQMILIIDGVMKGKSCLLI